MLKPGADSDGFVAAEDGGGMLRTLNIFLTASILYVSLRFFFFFFFDSLSFTFFFLAATFLPLFFYPFRFLLWY